jgi:hypothetical protein
MSASGVDRSNGIDHLSRVKEEYETREAKTSKRHNEEVKRIQEANNEAMRKLREDHNTQKNVSQEKMREALSERDMKFGKEMDEIRRMYSSRIRDQAERSGDERRILLANRDSELKKTIETKDRQAETLTRAFSDELENRDRFITDYADKTRVSHGEDLRGQRIQLQAAHKEAIENTRNELIEDLGEARFALNKSEEVRRADVDKLKEDAQVQKRRRENQFEDNLNRERKQFDRVYSDQRERASEGLEKTRQRYGEALKEFKEKRDIGRESVDQRVENKDARMSQKLREQQDLANVREMNLRAQASQERNNTLVANQRALKVSDDLRQQQTLDVRERAARDIAGILKKTEKEVQDLNLSNTQRMKAVENSERNHRLEIIGDFEGRLDQERQAGDLRQKKTMQNAHEELRANASYFNDRIEELQQDGNKDLEGARTRADKERVEQVTQLRKQAMKTDLARNEKMTLVEHKHAAERDLLIKGQQKNLKRVHNFYQKQLEQKDKEMRDKLESLREYGDSRLAEQAERYRAEAASAKKAHEAEKLELIKKRSEGPAKA